MYKIFYMLLGYILMGIGIAGFYLPLLPGVFFLILAAYCFMKASPKYYNKIISNKLYGHYIKNFIEHKIIPKRIKVIIIIFIWTFSLGSIFYLFDFHMLYTIPTLLIAIISTVIVSISNNE